MANWSAASTSCASVSSLAPRDELRPRGSAPPRRSRSPREAARRTARRPPSPRGMRPARARRRRFRQPRGPRGRRARAPPPRARARRGTTRRPPASPRRRRGRRRSKTKPPSACSIPGAPFACRSPWTLRQVQSGVSSIRTGRSAASSRWTTPTAGEPCAIASSRSSRIPPICQRQRGTPSSRSNETSSSWPRGSTVPFAPLVRGEAEARVAADEHRVERGETEIARARPVDRDGEQAVVAARAEPGDGAHRVAADAVGDQPLPLRRLVQRSAHLGAEADRHGGGSAFGRAISSPSVGTYAPRARRISSPTSPVQPVWWLAPSPAPLSPWKYSLNRTLSFQAGSVCSRSTQPKHGRRPSAPTRKSEISRSRRSAAISSSVSSFPEPVGYSTFRSSPKKRA